MKIQYKHGDLLKSPLKFIAHGCNKQGGFGSGIARQISITYPEAKNDYLQKYKNCSMGDIIPTKIGDMTIFNCITQEFYGPGDKKYVSYTALKKAFEEIEQYNKIYKVDKLGIPKIGAGLAGGNWEIISNIIENVVKSFEVHCYVI